MSRFNVVADKELVKVHRVLIAVVSVSGCNCQRNILLQAGTGKKYDKQMHFIVRVMCRVRLKLSP